MTTSRALEALNSLVELTDRKHTAKALAKIIEAALSAEEIEGLDEAIELAEFRRLNRNMETQRVSLPTRCLDTLLKAARQGRGG